MSLKENKDFFFDLFESQTIPDSMDSIAHINNPRLTLLTNSGSDILNNKRVFYSIKSVPKYLIVNPNSNYKSYKIAQYHKGYSIRIDENIDTLDAYMKLQFKSNAYRITRYRKRLETCYDIEYKMHYGTISKNEYDTLFKSLRLMLEVRFKQKKEINDSLLEWERLYNMFFLLINERKASIFVIYESDKPISISLNYIFGKFYFNAIASYNLDYSKFGLGHVMYCKQLDWCINNKFSLYEMGRGDFHYKQRWSNQIYDLEHFILVPIKSNFITVIAYKIEIGKIQLFEYLRSKKYNIIYNKVKNGLYHLNVSKTPKAYNTNTFTDIKAINEMEMINYEHNDYLKLHKPVNDFLFSNSIHKKTVKVYKTTKNTEFVIGLKNKFQKISFL